MQLDRIWSNDDDGSLRKVGYVAEEVPGVVVVCLVCR